MSGGPPWIKDPAEIPQVPDVASPIRKYQLQLGVADFTAAALQQVFLFGKLMQPGENVLCARTEVNPALAGPGLLTAQISVGFSAPGTEGFVVPGADALVAADLVNLPSGLLSPQEISGLQLQAQLDVTGVNIDQLTDGGLLLEVFVLEGDSVPVTP